MNREDFEILKTNIIYFDNGATTLKPRVLSEATSDYYNNYSANIHRGDYDISLKSDLMYAKTRKSVKNLINARDENEIVYTSGTTDSLNKIIFGYFRDKLTAADEVLLTKAEHASNILPWFELSEEIGFKVKYIPLNKEYKVTMDNVIGSITPNTKVISIAHITNVIGDIRPIKEIIKYAHEHGIIVIIDGAQSVSHIPVDVQDLDIDFLTFSAHKMCGPTGVGIIYGKRELLNNIRPIMFGGGMNATFTSDGIRIYDDIPELLEAGTTNIAGVIGYGATIEYLMHIGMNNIHKHEVELKEYALKRLQEIPNIIIYNQNSESSIVTINLNDIFAQDLAIYLNKYKICVRAGNHCAKILKDELGIKNTVRISFYFYNTKEEIDKLIEVLKNPNLKNEIIN